MGKLRYYYGVMDSAKTATLLTKAHNFQSKGCNVVLLKPMIDTRDKGLIKSRPIKESKECIVFDHLQCLYNIIEKNSKVYHKNVVFIDEVQFCTPLQVRELWSASKRLNVDIYCYGLKTTANNTLFDSAKELFLYADTVEEIKSMCICGEKATTHLFYINEDIMLKPNEVHIGDIKGEEKYVSLCQSCREIKIKKYNFFKKIKNFLHLDTKF